MKTKQQDSHMTSFSTLERVSVSATEPSLRGERDDR
jgi:hypothetical protein